MIIFIERFGRADAQIMARLRYALLDAPFGGIKPYLQARKRLPAVVDDVADLATLRAVLCAIEGPQAL